MYLLSSRVRISVQLGRAPEGGSSGLERGGTAASILTVGWYLPGGAQGSRGGRHRVSTPRAALSVVQFVRLGAQREAAGGEFLLPVQPPCCGEMFQQKTRALKPK